MERGYLEFAEGSVLMSMGRTRVLCSATIEEKVPGFLKGSGRGWMTAEYAMLPGSSPMRIPRESRTGRVGGRTHEIQRLIGRSLRAVFDPALLGERTVVVDCDVIQADGGTRTAAITGAFVAVHDALSAAVERGLIASMPLTGSIAAVSVGVVDSTVLLDLDYEEDSKAEVDMNVVMTGSGRFVEVQGTAEAAAFTRDDLDRMLEAASAGISELQEAQTRALAAHPRRPAR